MSWAVVLTSILALAAAVSALAPRIKNYAENAACHVSCRLRCGESKGSLIDTLDWMKSNKANDTVVRAIVAEFELIKKSKDSMRYVPIRSEEPKNAQKSLTHNRIGRRVLPKKRPTAVPDEKPPVADEEGRAGTGAAVAGIRRPATAGDAALA